MPILATINDYVITIRFDDNCGEIVTVREIIL